MVQNDQGDASFLKDDGVYEIVERYNNTEGRTRRGYRQCWSGHELIHLGLSGMLEPVSSHVYEFIDKSDASTRQQLLLDSFWRYQNYGLEYRVRHSYAARAFIEAADSAANGFEQFSELFTTLATWIQKKRQMGHTAVAGLLAETAGQLHSSANHY
jgi:hypothetical protein